MDNSFFNRLSPASVFSIRCIVILEIRLQILKDLQLIPAGHFSFVPDGYGYLIRIDGEPYTPDELLHFVINPSPDYPWKGCGYRTALKDIANNLKQATATKEKCPAGINCKSFKYPCVVSA